MSPIMLTASGRKRLLPASLLFLLCIVLFLNLVLILVHVLVLILALALVLLLVDINQDRGFVTDGEELTVSKQIGEQ